MTREGGNDLLTEHGIEGEIDLLSIDIDGNDYWIWEAITVVTPRVVVIEYNAGFGPERAVAVPYRADFNRKEIHRLYYGASLQALNRLARRKGYRLVAVEPRGVNAFFVRDDVGPEIPAVTPEDAYRRNVKPGPRYGAPLIPAQVTKSLGLPELVEANELSLVEID